MATGQITPRYIMTDAAFALEREARRTALMPIQRLRRIELGAHCSFIFESYDTMLFQIQKMLLTEDCGAQPLAEAFAAFTPLIPQGRELLATVMFVTRDDAGHAALPPDLGGVEGRFFLKIGEVRISGERQEAVPPGREAGTTSSERRIRFTFSDAQAEQFRAGKAAAMIGCDHPAYRHLAVISPDSRMALARDLA